MPETSSEFGNPLHDRRKGVGLQTFNKIFSRSHLSNVRRSINLPFQHASLDFKLSLGIWCRSHFCRLQEFTINCLGSRSIDYSAGNLIAKMTRLTKRDWAKVSWERISLFNFDADQLTVVQWQPRCQDEVESQDGREMDSCSSTPVVPAARK